MASSVDSLVAMAKKPKVLTITSESQMMLVAATELLMTISISDPVSESDYEVQKFIDCVRKLLAIASTQWSESERPLPDAIQTQLTDANHTPLTDERIAQLKSTLTKTTTIYLPIDGFYIKGENTCEMKFTTNKEIEGL